MDMKLSVGNASDLQCLKPRIFDHKNCHSFITICVVNWEKCENVFQVNHGIFEVS